MAYRAEANCGCQMELDTASVTYCKTHDKPIAALERRAAIVPELVGAGDALLLRIDRAGREGRCNPVFAQTERDILRAALARAKAVLG